MGQCGGECGGEGWGQFCKLGGAQTLGGTLAGFRWSLIPAVESHTGRQVHHTGQDICTIWAKNQKLLKRASLLMGEESRCQAEAGQVRGGGRGWKATQRTFRTHPANPTWHTWGILHAARQIQVSCTFCMFCTWCKCSHTLPVQTSKIKIARSVGLT